MSCSGCSSTRPGTACTDVAPVPGDEGGCDDDDDNANDVDDDDYNYDDDNDNACCTNIYSRSN